MIPGPCWELEISRNLLLALDEWKQQNTPDMKDISTPKPGRTWRLVWKNSTRTTKQSFKINLMATAEMFCIKFFSSCLNVNTSRSITQLENLPGSFVNIQLCYSFHLSCTERASAEKITYCGWSERPFFSLAFQTAVHRNWMLSVHRVAVFHI